MGSKSRDRRSNLRATRRGALQSAELLVVLPVLGLVLMGTVEMGAYFMQQHRLQAAADNACRAGLGQFQSDEHRALAIEEDFYSTLGDVAWTEKCELNVALDDPSSDRVTVTVKVPTRAVVPDLLGWVGLGIGEEQWMSAQSTLRRS